MAYGKAGLVCRGLDSLGKARQGTDMVVKWEEKNSVNSEERKPPWKLLEHYRSPKAMATESRYLSPH